MNPEDFFKGGAPIKIQAPTQSVSADEFFKGGAPVKVEPEKPVDANPISSFIGQSWDKYKKGTAKLAEGVANFEIGAVKGAASTIGNVASSVGRVTSAIVDAKQQKAFNNLRTQNLEQTDRLRAFRDKQEKGSPLYEKYNGLIEEQIKKFNEIGQMEGEVRGEIQATEQAFTDKPDFLKPTTTGQKIGYGTEKVAEFLVPSAAIAKGEKGVKAALDAKNIAPGLKKVLQIGTSAGMEAVGSGTVAAAQGGNLDDVKNAAFWGGIFSVPFKALAAYKGTLGGGLATSAEKSASKALGATGKGNKEISDKVVPELLKRRVTFLTRGGLEDKAAASADDVAEKIESAYDALPSNTKAVVTPVIEKLEQAKSALMVKGTTKIPEAAQGQYTALQSLQDEILGLTAKGPVLSTVGDDVSRHFTEANMILKELPDAPIAEVLERTKINIADGIREQLAPLGASADDITKAIREIDISQMSSLDDLKGPISKALYDGADVSADSLRSYRQILDKVINRAGKGFGLTGTETDKLAARKIAANSIRNELNEQFPNIGKLNKEFNFWKNVEEVVGATVQRTKSQAQPLGQSIIEGGAAAGAIARGSKTLDVVLTATGFGLLKKAITSPAYNMMSGVMKQRLADAILSGNAAKVGEISTRIINGTINAKKNGNAKN